MRRYKTFCSCIQGNGHVAKGTPCQDKASALQQNGVTALSLCDGAGSRRLSHHGAACVARTTCRFLCDQFDESFAQEDASVVKQDMYKAVGDMLQKTAWLLGCVTDDLACTWLFVAVKGNHFLAGHLGDGAIGVVRTDGQAAVLSKPFNGECANQTVFFTTNGSISEFHLYKGSVEGLQGFIMFSDGAGDSLYENRTGTLAKYAVNLIGQAVKKPEDVMDRLLERKVLPLLRKRTSDDCSVGILTICVPKDTHSHGLDRYEKSIFHLVSATFRKRTKRLNPKTKHARKALQSLKRKRLIVRKGEHWFARQ